MNDKAIVNAFMMTNDQLEHVRTLLEKGCKVEAQRALLGSIEKWYSLNTPCLVRLDRESQIRLEGNFTIDQVRAIIRAAELAQVITSL